MARTYTKRDAVGSIITIPSIDTNLPRHTVAISYFDDAALTIPSASPVGTFTVEGIAPGNQTYTPFDGSPIDATVAGSISTAGSPITELKVTPSGVSGTSYYLVTLTSNES